MHTKEELIIQQGERLKALRKYLKISQKEFSDLLDADQSYISQIERGKRSIPMSMLHSMIMNIQPSINMNWLLYGYDNMFFSEGASKAEEPTANYQTKQQIEQVQGTMQILIKQLDDIKGQ